MPRPRVMYPSFKTDLTDKDPTKFGLEIQLCILEVLIDIRDQQSMMIEDLEAIMARMPIKR